MSAIQDKLTLDARAFARAKPGLHVVNIARGDLIDQDALRDALDRDIVSAASLDAVTPEPLPAGHWLYSHPKVRLSPHISWMYLHYVLDLWANQWRKRHARGEVYIVRYADDMVMGFQYEQDARAMREALATRLAKFGLELHPEKTRVIRFGRFALEAAKATGHTRPETFDFLGFTHIAGVDRHGKFQLKRRTSRKKRKAKLATLGEEIRKRRHEPLRAQHKWLASVLQGHYQYYGVPTNSLALHQFREQVRVRWHRQLQRRSQRAGWNRAQLAKFEKHFPLPQPRIHHPWPSLRRVKPLT